MPKKYTHLSLEERALIQTQLLQGFKPAVIAAGLNRHRSCITRELARNGWQRPSTIRVVGRPPIAGGYSIDRAHTLAQSLTAKPRVPRKLVVGNALWNKVADGLCSGLSPEQICPLLRLSRKIQKKELALCPKLLDHYSFSLKTLLTLKPTGPLKWALLHLDIETALDIKINLIKN